MKNFNRKFLIGAISAIAVACCVCLCIIGLNKPSDTDSSDKFFTLESDSAVAGSTNGQESTGDKQIVTPPINSLKAGYIAPTGHS